jgi:dihydropteroate synthase
MYQEEEGMDQQELMIGKYRFPLSQRTLVMGIINVTPDSFSDGGKYNTVEKAVERAHQLKAEGADLLDIGGESTRPNYQPVGVEEELERVIPVIERISREVDLPISIDTHKAEVAKQAIQAGAHLINDIWGGRKDPDMARVVAEFDVPIVIMHNREVAQYDSLIEEIQTDLLFSVEQMRKSGVRKENIILDPGIGFGKTYEQNLEVMRKLEKIVELGYPVLLGTSRKSLIGNTLNLPPEERLEGTAATVALGIVKGCKIMRVHDVKEMVRVCRMMDAMLYGPQSERS